MTKYYTIQDKQFELTYNLTESDAWDIMKKYPNEYKVFEQIPPKDMSSKERILQEKRDEAYFKRTPIFNQKTSKKKSKFIGNMFRASSSKLNSIAKTGTTKQKAFALRILNKRKSKR